MRADIIEGATATHALAEEWDELVRSTAKPSIYATSRYTLASWEQFDAHQSAPLLVAIRSGEDQLVGLAPLRIRKRRRGLLSERVLENLATVEVDRVSILLRPGSEQAALASVIDTVRSLAWDVWELPEVVAGSATDVMIEKCLGDGYSVRRTPAGVGLLIDLARTRDDFMTDHKKFARAMRRFERLFPEAAVDVHESATTILDGLADYRAIEQASWKAGTHGLGKSPNHDAFFADVLPRLAEEGQVQLRVLKNGDDLLAGQIHFLIEDQVYFHATVYHPDHAAESPGKILNGLALDDYFGGSATTGDFLTGHAGYLSSWCSSEIETVDLAIERRNLTTALIRLQQTSAARVDALRDRRRGHTSANAAN